MTAALRLRKKSEMDMTQGKIMPLLINFALPLLLGNLFQQLYNTVDTWVVGNFVGKNSFSAVGTLSSVLNMVISFFMGFSSGASVVIAQYYGAKDNENVSKTTHTFIAVTLIMCVACTAVGIGMIPMILRILKSPAEVAVEQTIYMTIYFAGITGLLIYNMGSAILRAIGNSTDPFIFLVVSAVLNIILDLLFVIVFKMGTAGVAWATVIAQMVSAILCMWVLFRTDTAVRFMPKKIRIYGYIMKKIFRIGLPSAIQMAITCFSNIFVQSYINQFGADVMGGWTAYIKVDQILMLPTQSISLGTQTFVGQNLGIMQTERTRKGVRDSIIMSFVITIILMIPVMIFAAPIVSIFISASETGVIHYGAMLIVWITPWYLVTIFNQIYGGALRGAGRSSIPMVVMLFSFVFFRQMYLFIVSNYISNTIIPIAMGYPAGWLMCSILLTIGYKRNFSDEKLRGNAVL